MQQRPVDPTKKAKQPFRLLECQVLVEDGRKDERSQLSTIACQEIDYRLQRPSGEANAAH